MPKHLGNVLQKLAVFLLLWNSSLILGHDSSHNSTFKERASSSLAVHILYIKNVPGSIATSVTRVDKYFLEDYCLILSAELHERLTYHIYLKEEPSSVKMVPHKRKSREKKNQQPKIQCNVQLGHPPKLGKSIAVENNPGDFPSPHKKMKVRKERSDSHTGKRDERGEEKLFGAKEMGKSN